MDLTVQQIKNEFAIIVYESNIRICLEVNDFSEFVQCQTQLNLLYKNNKINEKYKKNYMEFLCYNLLYQMIIKRFDKILKILKNNKKYLNDINVRIIINMINEMRNFNFYITAFKNVWNEF